MQQKLFGIGNYHPYFVIGTFELWSDLNVFRAVRIDGAAANKNASHGMTRLRSSVIP